ncbi:hypothetical protein ACFPN4_09860 [Ureibacillus thermophilus]|uniref:hypothetical protein n=1 Tax=Ureibacillus thermophilus TaxID=367743 RepID=UPI00361B3D4D
MEWRAKTPEFQRLKFNVTDCIKKRFYNIGYCYRNNTSKYYVSSLQNFCNKMKHGTLIDNSWAIAGKSRKIAISFMEVKAYNDFSESIQLQIQGLIEERNMLL